MIVSEEKAISASKEAYVEMLKPYEEQGKVDNDPALKDRVYRITGRLIAQAIEMRPETKDWDWSIKIIDNHLEEIYERYTQNIKAFNASH